MTAHNPHTTEQTRVSFADDTMRIGLTVFEIGIDDGESIASHRRIGHMRSLVRNRLRYLCEHSGGSEATAMFFEAMYRHGVHYANDAKDVSTPKVVRRFVYENNIRAQTALDRLFLIGHSRGLRQAFSPTFLNDFPVRDKRRLSPFRAWRVMWSGAIAVARVQWAFAQLGMPAVRASVVDDQSRATDLIAEGHSLTCAIQVKGTVRHEDLFVLTFRNPPSSHERQDVHRFWHGAREMAERYGGPWVPLYIEVGLKTSPRAPIPAPWIREDPWLPTAIMEGLRNQM